MEVVEYVHTFLVGTVLFITAVGLYQLFITDVKFPGWLRIDSTEDLETNLIGVTVVVLAVNFMSRAFLGTRLIRFPSTAPGSLCQSLPWASSWDCAPGVPKWSKIATTGEPTFITNIPTSTTTTASKRRTAPNCRLLVTIQPGPTVLVNHQSFNDAPLTLVTSTRTAGPILNSYIRCSKCHSLIRPMARSQ